MREEELRENLPIVQLDKYYPKLANEEYVKLFISDEDFGKIIKVRNGYMVPILALNYKEKQGRWLWQI